MAIGGHGAQHAGALAFGRMQVDAVEIVASLFRADREPRAVDQPTQHLRRKIEPMRQCARRHGGKILCRQHDKAGRIATGTKRKLRIAAWVVELHLGALRQLANDLIQRRSRCGARSIAGRARWHVLNNGDFHIGGGERQLAVAHGEHDVGQDWNGVASLYHALDVGQGLQQGGPVGLQLHGINPQSAGLQWCPGESTRAL